MKSANMTTWGETGCFYINRVPAAVDYIIALWDETTGSFRLLVRWDVYKQGQLTDTFQLPVKSLHMKFAVIN